MLYRGHMVSESVTLNELARGCVIQNSEQRVRSLEHKKIAALLDKVRWDDLDVLRNMENLTSFRQAARRLKLALNTVRFRISRLEEDLETTIYVRGRSGLHLTDEGRIVVQIAREMKQLSTQLPVAADQSGLIRQGEIRIGTTEGLGTFWLAPRLAELKGRLPKHVVMLNSSVDQGEGLGEQFDITVGYTRPVDLEAIVSKVATVHMIPFASDEYLRTRGEPTDVENVLGHTCVQHDAPGLNYDALRLFLGEEMMKDVVGFKVNSSQSLLTAVANGLGIAALPTYIAGISSRVRPIALPIRLKFDVWMTFSRRAQKSISAREGIEWVRESFDSVRYPWFKEHFVHPDDFPSATGGYQISHLLDHLIDESL